MAEYRSSSIVGATVLIGLGVLFLYTNSHPGIDPWPLLGRYWPLLLIFVGLGKLWDYYHIQKNPGGNRRLITGGEIAVIVLIVVFVVALSRHRGFHEATARQHEGVDYGGAQSAQVDLQMAAGDLQLFGGASKLLNADLDYNKSSTPEVSYQVNGTGGHLVVKKIEHSHVRLATGWGGEKNVWDHHLGNKIPMELKVEIGAGRGTLRLTDLPLTKLDVQMGAGSATILLPRNVGVEVHADGGLGSVNAHGLKKDGDRYVNDAFGKSPITVELHVEGGVGSIDLIPEM